MLISFSFLPLPSVLKVVERGSAELEIWLHHRVGHSVRIISLWGVIQHEDFDILVVGFAKHGDLHRFLSSSTTYPFTNDELSTIIPQMVEAVRICHWKGFGHRNIKLSNFLLGVEKNWEDPDGRRCLSARLRDLGLATKSRFSRSFGLGTKGYMSLEVEAAKDYNYSPMKNNIWALGVTLLTLLEGGNLP